VKSGLKKDIIGLNRKKVDILLIKRAKKDNIC
jgi:hypothetical protein